MSGIFPINPKPYLSTLSGTYVLVKLKWGNEYRGYFVSYDTFLNIELTDTEEWVRGISTGNLGNVLIRCNNVLYIRPVSIEEQKEQWKQQQQKILLFQLKEQSIRQQMQSDISMQPSQESQSLSSQMQQQQLMQLQQIQMQLLQLQQNPQLFQQFQAMQQSLNEEPQRESQGEQKSQQIYFQQPSCSTQSEKVTQQQKQMFPQQPSSQYYQNISQEESQQKLQPQQLEQQVYKHIYSPQLSSAPSLPAHLSHQQQYISEERKPQLLSTSQYSQLQSEEISQPQSQQTYAQQPLAHYYQQESMQQQPDTKKVYSQQLTSIHPQPSTSQYIQMQSDASETSSHFSQKENQHHEQLKQVSSQQLTSTPQLQSSLPGLQQQKQLSEEEENEHSPQYTQQQPKNATPQEQSQEIFPHHVFTSQQKTEVELQGELIQKHTEPKQEPSSPIHGLEKEDQKAVQESQEVSLQQEPAEEMLF